MINHEPIKLEVKNRVAHLVLNKLPDNRMDLIFFSRIKEVIGEIETDQEVGAVLIYGNRRHFSAGADLEDIKGSIIRPFRAGLKQEEIVAQESLKNVNIYLALECLRVPVIAVVTGFCLGSGMELALAADLRIATAEALFGLPEITWGLMTGCSGSIRLARLVGKSRAEELLLTGGLINGLEAQNIGIANMIMDKKNILLEATRLAEKLADIKRKEINAYLKEQARSL